MEILQAILLGIIQGISEFLPISSSGHLIVLPRIFGWHDEGLAFDVALHFGTLIAIILYFYNDWIEIFKKSYFINQVCKIFVDRKREFFEIKKLKEDLLAIIIISTIPGILAGLFLEKRAETAFRNPLLVGFSLLAGAILLFFADKIGKRNLKEKDITLKTGIITGLLQMFAIIPGMSRSGTTISAGLIMGLDRATAARFSFLLATPIILGATLKEFSVFMHTGLSPDLLVGILSAFISGYLAIKYLLKYLENRSYKVFVIYRIIFALVIFLLFYK